MIIVIVVSHRCKINPDNIATPLAAALGDLTTLSILAGIGGLFFQIIGKISILLTIEIYRQMYSDNYTWLPIAITTFFLTLIPVWVIFAKRNKYVSDVLIDGWYDRLFGEIEC